MPGFERGRNLEKLGLKAQDTAELFFNDVIVPVENSIRWAREHQAALHILNSDHRLEDRIEAICILLRAFLVALQPTLAAP